MKLQTPLTLLASVPVLALGLASTSYAPAPEVQTWEKSISPGFSFRMQVDSSFPRTYVAVRMTRGAEGVTALPALPNKTVFDNSPTVGRGTMTKTAEQYSAFGAINADFFPFSSDRATGDPLGFMAAAGELISGPGRQRSSFAWGENESKTGVASMIATAQPSGGAPLKISGINEECPLNAITLYSPIAGLALVKQPSIALFLEPTSTKIPLDGQVNTKVVAVTSNVTSTPVNPSQWILAGNGTAADSLRSIPVGSTVTVTIKCAGFDWNKTPNVVGGGPNLISNGETRITAEEEGFGASFASTRHPRTAVGRTKDGDIWWVVVDGRSKHSVGASLPELADIMRSLGCIDAINLDGGGSSSLVLGGAPVNHPSGGVERAVANGVVFKVPTNAISPVKSIRAERTGTRARLSALDASGKVIPNAQVIWQCSGRAWVDQAGVVHSLTGGDVKVSAWCGGARAETTVMLPPTD
jgi:hypothetical protein